MRHFGAGYKDRDDVLFRLGFVDYGAYLRSDLWLSIKARKLVESPTCELCGKPATCVHHLAYRLETLNGKKLHALVCLCNGCHEDIEIDKDGRKRNFEGAMKRTKKLLQKAGKWEQHTFRGSKAAEG